MKLHVTRYLTLPITVNGRARVGIIGKLEGMSSILNMFALTSKMYLRDQNCTLPLTCCRLRQPRMEERGSPPLPQRAPGPSFKGLYDATNAIGRRRDTNHWHPWQYQEPTST